jgi:hypothetical protein
MLRQLIVFVVFVFCSKKNRFHLVFVDTERARATKQEKEHSRTRIKGPEKKEEKKRTAAAVWFANDSTIASERSSNAAS